MNSTPELTSSDSSESGYAMNEYSTSDHRGEATGGYVTRRSPALAIVGVLTLGVAGWGLLGGPTLPDASATAWVLVAVGLVAGLLLILSGAVSARKS